MPDCGRDCRWGAKFIPTMLHSSTMADEHANSDSAIREVVRILKLKIPPEDHAALDSRVQELMNDPSTDGDDVISILRDEFDPA